MDMNTHEHAQRQSRSRWVFILFALIALFFLVSEHRAHFFGALPYLLLFACPLLHLFHGHGHGHHHGSDQGSSNGQGPGAGPVDPSSR